MMHLIAVAVGGSLGALSRYGLGHYIHTVFPRSFPYGTLSANFFGSFLIGIAFVLILQKPELDPVWRLGLVVGFLGAFTTFSTFSLESLLLIQQTEYIRAFFYIFLSFTGCIIATMLGTITGRFFT